MADGTKKQGPDRAPGEEFRWWPDDEGGWAVAVYLLMLAHFIFPLLVAIRKFMIPALFTYCQHAASYIRMPFP